MFILYDETTLLSNVELSGVVGEGVSLLRIMLVEMKYSPLTSKGRSNKANTLIAVFLCHCFCSGSFIVDRLNSH